MKNAAFLESYVMNTGMPPLEQPAQPQIVEAYREYSPPSNARRDVERLLRHIPPEYLTGLQSILLTNSSALSRDERRQKIWSRNRKVQLGSRRGWYSYSTRASGARITLLVDRIFRGETKFTLAFSSFRMMTLGSVLWHEVGHHIHATRRPEYRGKEDVADDWKTKLEKRYIRERYWYLLPVALLFKLARDLKSDAVRLAQFVKRRCRAGEAGK